MERPFAGVKKKKSWCRRQYSFLACLLNSTFINEPRLLFLLRHLCVPLFTTSHPLSQHVCLSLLIPCYRPLRNHFPASSYRIKSCLNDLEIDIIPGATDSPHELVRSQRPSSWISVTNPGLDGATFSPINTNTPGNPTPPPRQRHHCSNGTFRRH